MKFIYGKQTLSNMKRGQEVCYLMTNGLGGYSSMTAIGSCNRADHALFMTAVSAPCERFSMISKIEECIKTESQEYWLSSQEYTNHSKDDKGYQYLEYFIMEETPVWQYQVDGIEVRKEIVMEHGKNVLAVRYRIVNNSQKTICFYGIPWLQFSPKGEKPLWNQKYETNYTSIKSVNRVLFYQTNGEINILQDSKQKENVYYEYDERDGRTAVGRMTATHLIQMKVASKEQKELCILYSLDKKEKIEDLTEYVEQMFRKEKKRLEDLRVQSGLTSEVAKQLVNSADAYLVHRESTKEKTIIAGYPFFGDWGRDTMLAMNGLCLATERMEDAKSIFRSFIAYCRNGIMPNMFPESGKEPLYNTVDASLLFILAIYEYYQKTKDLKFLKEEAWDTMKEIILWYKNGTDFHIYMDTDGLLCAGADLEQVTWMDVRYEDILPTPRQGKAVEINAWWYNSLCIMSECSRVLQEDGEMYQQMAEKVKQNYTKTFWNAEENCLKDTASRNKGDTQIRCNQIWTVSAPFSVLTEEKERAVVDKVYEELYTSCGLRTLSMKDKEFCPIYEGSMYKRDMAYHQGTVWVFPLGAYYLAYLKVNKNSQEAKERVQRQLMGMEDNLREGCAGQLPEIYDGKNPTQSRGCFAQAWSVGEILRVYKKLEEI